MSVCFPAARGAVAAARGQMPLNIFRAAPTSPMIDDAFRRRATAERHDPARSFAHRTVWTNPRSTRSDASAASPNSPESCERPLSARSHRRCRASHVEEELTVSTPSTVRPRVPTMLRFPVEATTIFHCAKGETSSTARSVLPVAMTDSVGQRLEGRLDYINKAPNEALVRRRCSMMAALRPAPDKQASAGKPPDLKTRARNSVCCDRTESNSSKRTSKASPQLQYSAPLLIEDGKLSGEFSHVPLCPEP